MLELAGSVQAAMDRSAVGPTAPLAGAVPARRRLAAAGIVCVALAGGLAQRTVGQHSPSVSNARSSGSVANSLASLPAAARAPVSSVLGAAEPAYGVSPSASGFQAVSQAQRLHAAFDRSGVLLTSGALRVGLSLRAMGYGSALRAPGQASVRVAKNRVLYARHGLAEWYVNGPFGLEQGFTLPRAPSAHTMGPLTLSLALSGDTHPALAAGRQSITFSASDGSSLRYGGLVATDARGRTLPSWLALAHGALLLQVDARGARYPLRIDPLIQQAKLTASVGSNSGFFGSSVALSADGNTALVGAPSVKNLGGTAWVFTRSGPTWTQQAALTIKESGAEGSCEAGEEAGECGFGRAVALSANGETALIGAPRYEGGHGAAWVFTHTGSGWSLPQILPAVKKSGNKGRFGRSVALSGDGNTALVGGPADKNGVGEVGVFTRASGWNEQGAALTDTEEAAKGGFGLSLALSLEGNTALIGSGGAGAAWVFTRSGETWAQTARLLGAEPSGGSVALSADGHTALIGGRHDGGNAGAAWVFTRVGSEWPSQGLKLTGAEEVEEGEFGASVALSADGNTAAVGGPGDGGPRHLGAVWAFVRSGSTWASAGRKHVGREQLGNTRFGASVALSVAPEGATVLVGGPSDNGKVGAAWVFVEAAHEETLHEEETGEKETKGNEPGPGSSGSPGLVTTAGGVLGFGAVAGTATCKVALISKSLTVLSHSRAALKLRRTAGAGACTGSLRLTVKKKAAHKRTKTLTIGAGTFSLAPGKAQAFTVKLNAAGRALLKAGHGRLQASLVIVRLSPHPAQAQTASVRLALAKLHPATPPKK